MSPAALRSVSFAALAGFVALNWVAMVVSPPLALTALAVALIAATATTAAAIADRHGFGAPARAAAVVVPTLMAMIAAMVIVGLPARLLLPSGWAELLQGVDVGLAGIGEGVSYPYDGPNEWSRLITLAAAPMIVALAALVVFVPRAAPGSARLGGLAVLVVAYAVAATTYDPSAPVLRGAVLCLLVAAWLWIPTLRGRRQWALAASLVVVALAVAAPLTAAYGDGEGLVDYHSWDWGSGAGSSFDWEHGYGPIDWDRDGETVFIVRSDRPNYWKARVLDRFNGTSWVRSDIDRAPSELPSSLEPGLVQELNPEWATRVQVTVDELRSDLVVGPGTDRSVISGVEAHQSADHGEVRAVEPLGEGDAYEVRGYAPDPTVGQMRAAGSDYGLELAHFSAIDLPGASGLPTSQVRTIGIDGAAAIEAEEQIRRSPYRRMLELAQRIGADSPSAYDTVKRIEEYLQANYRYSETPPDRAYPLSSFLFEDRIGYCQQFSGSMALMVRMLGIPSRVATGFSPGIADRSGKRFRVRDLDAHSWVEVYFNGIGWVPFDPTPPEAPAELQGGGGLSATAAASALGSLLALGPGVGLRQAGADGAGIDRSDELGNGLAASGSSGGGLGSTPLVVALGLVVVLAASIAVPAGLRSRRAGALPESELSQARVRELHRALSSLGWRIDPDTTLLELEQRLRSRAEPGAAAYLAAIRAVRYQPRSAAPPRLGAAGRRSLRRRLSQGRGAAARLRALWVIPLGAPRL